MEETRYENFSDRVFTLEDIKKIAGFVYDEFNTKLVPNKGGRGVERYTLTLGGEDNSRYESQDNNILFDKKIVTTKHIIKIEIDGHFDDFEGNKRGIDISFDHGDVSDTAKITGTDSNWVNGTLGTVKELISGVRPQDKKNKNIASIVSFIGVFYFFMLVIGFILFQSDDHAGSYSFLSQLENHYFFIPIFGFVFSFSIFTLIIQYLNKIFPSIEIQIGPEHKLLPKKIRNAYFIALSTLGFPLLISFLSIRRAFRN